MPGQTFTTYINAKRTGSVDAEFAALGAAGSRAFGQIKTSADAANRAVGGLTGGRGTGGVRSPISSAYLNGFDQAKIKADRLADAQARLARENSTLVRGLRTSANTLQVIQGPLGPLAGRVSAAADALVRLSGVTLGLSAAGAALFAYVRAANQFVEVRSKLTTLYDSQKDVNEALADVYGISQRARAGIAPVIDLYARLKLAADQYGFSQQRVSRITELATKAATLSGGTAQSREAGLYQFAQGFGSGTLGGDELKSVKENTLALARAISVGLGKLPEFKGVDTSIGKLKTLAEQGKLTADVIARAMEASASDIEARFAKLPPNLGMAFTALSNSATMFVGRFEEATGVVGTIASGILLLGNNLNVLVGILGGVAAGWAAVSAEAKIAAVGANVRGMIDAARLQQSTARSALALAVDGRNETVRQTVALTEQGNQIRANIAALEAELRVQQEIAAQGSVSMRAGLPGGAQQAALGQAGSTRVTRELADEIEHLSVVQTKAAAAGVKLENQNKAVGVATTAVTKSTSLFKMGLMGLLDMINPVGIAVALATAAFLSWATAESAAEKAAKKVEEAQRALATVIDFTTGKVREQNEALLASARLQASQGEAAALAQYTATRRKIGALAETVGPQIAMPGTGLPIQDTANLSATQRRAASLLETYGTGQGKADELVRAIDALAKADPSLRDVADQVDKLAGDAVKGAREVEGLRSSLRILKGTASPEDLRRAQGDFSGGRAQGEAGRDINAEVEALRAKLHDQRFAAETQKNEQLANLEKRRSQLTVDDYIREKAQIENTYDTALKSLDKQDEAAAKRAEREEARRQRAHEAELKRIEEENQRRQQRTERRDDILGRYSEETKAIVRARHDLQDLQDMVGKTMNGLEAITKANPLGQGIYTQEMAARDAANIEEGLQRPFKKYMEDRARDAVVSGLIASGHTNEAEALSRTLTLYDSIGKITMDQYNSVLETVRAEEKVNDVLAQRERLIGPLREGLGALRGEIAGAIESFLSGGSPLKAGQNLLKGILQNYNKIRAAELAEKLTAGLDQRVKDLVSGRTSVDSAIAQYLKSLNETVSSSSKVISANEKLATSAQNAAQALTAIATGVRAPGPEAGAVTTPARASVIPSSFYKPGVKIGGGIGDDVIFRAIGQLGAVITENLRSQSTQNWLFRTGKTTARVSDHTTSENAYDVRLPKGMTFAEATALITKAAEEMGAKVVKALDETGSGGTGPHGHYVIAAANKAAEKVTAAVKPALAIGTASTPAIVSVATVSSQAAKTLAGAADAGTPVAAAGRSPTSTADDYLKTVLANFGQNIDAQIGVPVSKEISKVFTKFFGSGGRAQTIGGGIALALANFASGQNGKGLEGALTSIGQAAAQMDPRIAAAMAATTALSQIFGVKNQAGGIFGFGGNLIAKFLGINQAVPHAMATISATGGILTAGSGRGNDAQSKAAASQMSSSLGDTIQQIVDQLDATLGDFKVSIGFYKGRYIVDPTGAGRSHGPNTPSFATEEEAVQAALMDAIQDGAIAGLSAASETILKKAKNLSAALNKVQIIESIPKQLMALKDPVRFAVTELNSQFSKMIAYLKEGGATAAQFAQAQELYDLERTKAVEQATSQATGAIQDMIDQMTGSSNSPLNRRTVYENAKTKLTGFATDIQAGKSVDTDKFLAAATNFQDASRELNGSTASFFDDFNFLLGLLTKAKDNITAGTTPSDQLPASPFDDASVQALINGTQGTTDAINNQTDVLGGLLGRLVDRFGGGTTNPASGITAIDLLPGSYGGGGLRTGGPLVQPY